MNRNIKFQRTRAQTYTLPIVRTRNMNTLRSGTEIRNTMPWVNESPGPCIPREKGCMVNNIDVFCQLDSTLKRKPWHVAGHTSSMKKEAQKDTYWDRPRRLSVRRLRAHDCASCSLLRCHRSSANTIKDTILVAQTTLHTIMIHTTMGSEYVSTFIQMSALVRW